MAREGFRKVSTTLFHRRNSDAGDWSGLLDNHKNLINHQLYFTASAPLSGQWHLHIIPDADGDIPSSVDTGYIIDFDGGARDSAFFNWTGVIRGIHLRVVDPFASGLTVSAVLSSFSRLREAGRREERYDYVSSTLFRDRSSTDLLEFSMPSPDHANMAYHQLMFVSDGPVAYGEYEVRVVPDVDEALETTVYINKNMWFPNDPGGGNGKSFLHMFGGVFRGIHLEAIVAPEPGHSFTAILSSSSERFDQITTRIISEVPDEHPHEHFTNYNNPHLTSWDNLLNKPDIITGYPFVTEIVPSTDTITIPVDHQMLVWEALDIQGTLEVNGKLVVLGDQPDEPLPTGPDMTYNGSDQLTQIDYDNGEQKVFTYNVSGQLERLDYIHDGITTRKDYFYTGGGLLDYVDGPFDV